MAGVLLVISVVTFTSPFRTLATLHTYNWLYFFNNFKHEREKKPTRKGCAKKDLNLVSTVGLLYSGKLLPQGYFYFSLYLPLTGLFIYFIDGLFTRSITHMFNAEQLRFGPVYFTAGGTGTTGKCFMPLHRP